MWTRFGSVALALALAGVALPAAARGQAWLMPVPLSTGVVSTEGADVAGDAAGNAVAVWVEGGTVQSVTKVPHGAWSAPRPLSTAGRAAQSPQVEMDAQGRVLAVWAEETPGGGQEIRHRSGSAAEGFGASAPLSAIEAGERAVAPQVAVNPTGAAAVVWTVVAAGPDRVEVATRERAAQRFGLPARVSVSMAADDAHDPRVAIDPQGNVAAIWHQRGTPPRIDSAVRAAGGEWRGLPGVDEGEIVESVPPAIALTPSGQAIAAWGGPTQFGLRVRYATRAAGPPFAAPAWEATDTGEPFFGDVALVLDADGTPVLVREYSYASYQLMAHPLPGTSSVQLSAGMGRTEPWTATARPGGGVLVQWNVGRLATRIWRSGGVLEPIRLVGNAVTGRAGVAIDDQDNVAAVWVSDDRAWTSTWDARAPALEAIAVPAEVPAGGEATLDVTATDRWSDPAVTWDFGDGTSATGARVSHVFTVPGRTTITVTATDRAGNATTATRTLEVRPPPRPAPPRDSDGDGSPDSVDCAGGNPAIHPTAPEVRGNAVDENCDGVIVPFPSVAATARLTTQYERDRSTRLLKLELRDLVRGDRVRLGCRGSGCRSRLRAVVRHTAARTSLSLTSRVRGVRLRPGARLEVTIERAGHVGRVYTFVMRASKTGAPKRTTRCVTPETTRTVSC